MAEFFFNLVPDWETVLSFFLIVVCSLVFIDGMLYLLKLSLCFILCFIGIIAYIIDVLRSFIDALRGRPPKREEEKKDNIEEEKKDE